MVLHTTRSHAGTSAKAKLQSLQKLLAHRYSLIHPRSYFEPLARRVLYPAAKKHFGWLHACCDARPHSGKTSGLRDHRWKSPIHVGYISCRGGRFSKYGVNKVTLSAAFWPAALPAALGTNVEKLLPHYSFQVELPCPRHPLLRYQHRIDPHILTQPPATQGRP